MTAARSARSAHTERRGAVIVGAGPAGLAAALELKRLGARDVLVLERESQAGGVPRMCHHTGFGWPDLRQVLSGPAYASNYARRAAAAGIEVRTLTSVTGWSGPRRITTTSPGGLGEIEADALLLATGCRERPRTAHLIPGGRPAGIFTTGSLQRFVYDQKLPVGLRAVIVGAELVSLSALLTLRHAGVRIAAFVTEQPRHQVYLPYLPAKWLWADLLSRTPVIARAGVARVVGQRRVEAVEIVRRDSGQLETLECDTLVFTGDWRPENDLARRHPAPALALDDGSAGPVVDSAFRTGQPGVFAAGNLVRGGETASQCALEGRAAASAMAAYLAGEAWPQAALRIEAQAPLLWVAPGFVAAGVSPSTRAFRFQVDRFAGPSVVRVEQAGALLHRQNYGSLRPNTPMHLNTAWTAQVDFARGPLRVSVEA